MVRLPRVLAIPALLLVAACSTGGADNVTRLKTEPILTGGTYSTGGGITIASTFRNVGGQTALCGLWSESAVQTPYSKGVAPQVLSSGAVYLDDQRLLSDLDFFRKIPATTDYTAVQAPCAVSDLPWRPDYADRVPDIRLPRQVVYADRGRVKGPIVEFRQTGPGALSRSLDPVGAIFGKVVRLPLGHSPAIGAGRYSSGGGVKVAVDLHQVGNAAYLCGVWSESRGRSPRTEMQAPEVLARAVVVADGETVIEDLRFLRRVPKHQPLTDGPANCIDTGRKWADVDDARTMAVRIPAFVIYAGPDRPITFSPTGAEG